MFLDLGGIDHLQSPVWGSVAKRTEGEMVA
jgi:hypothetical protein